MRVYGSVEEAIAAATANCSSGYEWALYGTRIDACAKDTGQLVEAMDHGRILAALDRLGHFPRAWLLLAYGSLTREDRQPIERMIAFRAFLAVYEGRDEIEIGDRLRRLAELAVGDYVQRIHGQSATPEAYMQQLGIGPEAWRKERMWHRVGQIFDLLAGWDRAGKAEVGRVLRGMRESVASG